VKLITQEIEKKFEEYPIGSQDGKGGKAEVIAKFFNPTGVGTWYITEGTKQDNGDYEMFGYCHLGDDNFAEFGTVMLSELQELKLPLGLEIERDLYMPKGTDLIQALKRDGIVPPQYLMENYVEDKNTMKLQRGSIYSYEDGLKQRVQEKLTNEYNDFIKELKNERPEVIIERAYEKVCKEEILYIFEKNDLSVNECKSLLKCPNILDDCYDEWLNSDGNFNEMLEYAVDNSVEHITEDFIKEQKQKNKDSR
jgi:hypothetical protein